MAIKIWSLKAGCDFGNKFNYVEMWDLLTKLCAPSRQVVSWQCSLETGFTVFGEILLLNGFRKYVIKVQSAFVY